MPPKSLCYRIAGLVRVWMLNMADRRSYGGSMPIRSPYAPKRRLIRGGPLGEPRVDVPRFLVEPDRRAVPTFHPDIDALEETLRCLKHRSVLGSLHVHSRMSREHHETTTKTYECVRLWRSLEPEGFVPPALLRAHSSKTQDLAPKRTRGALPILVASLTVTVAYLMTASWAP